MVKEMVLKPWYKVAVPREDLRKGKPLDASEFAIHLDQVVDGRAPIDYRDPTRFFSRTHLTRGLLELTAEVVRRLSGETIGASAVIILTTQFGGGKTHALTLLYHLAQTGPSAKKFAEVKEILKKAKVSSIPKVAVAIFVGSEFDYITGKGSKGEPIRKTPWGEIAWQLRGREGFKIVQEHDAKKSPPGKGVIRKILPENKPVLILMDEVLNFMTRARAERVGRSTFAAQFYEFLQALSEEASGRPGVCVVLSLPKSEQEMTAEDEADFGRLQKLATRVGKPYVLAEGLEIAEIIRKRLFEDLGPEREREATTKAYANWMMKNRRKLPTWFPVDHARKVFEATYPFHPVALSVFERKWQTLPKFQRTRAVLRMFALWVSKAYRDGFSGAHKDPLITIGSAPLEDTIFRATIFDQLGESRLEAAVMVDIAGEEAHAVRLDAEATDTIKKARLHRKVASTIFFESSGGQVREEATEPEIRLAVGEPELDLGNVDIVLDEISNAFYYLIVAKGNRYKFSITPNLNKLLADRRASISEPKIKELLEEEIKKVYSAGPRIERVFFPEKSGQIPDLPSITLVVLQPEHGWEENSRASTLKLIDTMTKEHGASARTFKSALLWAVADGPSMLYEEARKLLAWDVLSDESESLRLSNSQRKRLNEQLKRSGRDVKEAVWRSYRNILLLGKNGRWKRINLGLVHSSAAESLTKLVFNRLAQEGDLEESISPSFLVRNWPPALPEWSTKSLRDTFFASPQFPRLSKPDCLKRTIADGVNKGMFGYADKAPDGTYTNVTFDESFSEIDVEISDDVFLIPKETAQAIKSGVAPPFPPEKKEEVISKPPEKKEEQIIEKIAKVDMLTWEGDVPPQKWMNFYTRVLSRFPIGPTLKLHIKIEVKPEEGIPKQKVDETKTALRELGLSGEVKTESKKEENEE